MSNLREKDIGAHVRGVDDLFFVKTSNHALRRYTMAMELSIKWQQEGKDFQEHNGGFA